MGSRVAFRHAPAPSRPDVTQLTPTKPYYVVRPGDTLVAVAAKTGVSAARLRQLNPKVQPTALFIGQRIRLR
jgi:LysM repeat protein